MWKAILPTVKATFPFITGCLISALSITSLHAQQHVIVDKDNTRPENKRQYGSPANISSFTAKKFNGYNEISWNAMSEGGTRRFIAEYSVDGIDFQTAGQVLSTNGKYMLNHYTPSIRPLLYRIRIEELNGKVYYSNVALLDGVDVSPVQMYPTIVRGSVINANAALPVERIAIISSSGQQMFAKDMNGVRDLITVAIPALSKGLYFITFYGNGWQNTTRFMIG